ncbi:MAG: hypothetical protein KBF45_06995 [Cyclobacteriaceae bacterium]|jgi:hypothetical protein|nr:hypothetical protein [Cyclobacteriaceae bacterium]
MKKTIQTKSQFYAWGTSICLLLVVGISASLGGLALIIHPTGEVLNLNPVGLSNTMFTDFEAPGFILFFTVGILTLLAAILTMMKNPYYATFTFIQGAILTGWILAQVYLLPQTHFLQLIYLLLGLMLMLLGNFQKSRRAL